MKPIEHIIQWLAIAVVIIVGSLIEKKTNVHKNNTESIEKKGYWLNGEWTEDY